MENEIIMQVINRMMSVLNNAQLSMLKESMQLVLCEYNITVKETSLTCTENNSLRYLSMFLDSFKINGKSEGSVKQYKLHLERFLLYINKNVEDISDNDVINYIYKYKDIRKVSQRYLNNIRLVMNSFFKWLQRKHIIVRNPVD